MKSQRWSLALLIAGLAAMVIGAIDPIEGAAIILPGSMVSALGARLGKARYRRLLYWACGLIAAGVGALAVLTVLGGTGGDTGRSEWWGLFFLPYPAGWILGILGSFLSLREIRRERKTRAPSVL
jgi:hypothetical protein